MSDAIRLIAGIGLMLGFCAAVFGVGYAAHAAWDWIRR
jgi:hypothetical protein